MSFVDQTRCFEANYCWTFFVQTDAPVDVCVYEDELCVSGSYWLANGCLFVMLNGVLGITLLVIFSRVTMLCCRREKEGEKVPVSGGPQSCEWSSRFPASLSDDQTFNCWQCLLIIVPVGLRLANMRMNEKQRVNQTFGCYSSSSGSKNWWRKKKN